MQSRPSKSEMSRSDIIRRDDWNLPDVEPFDYLLEIFFEIGISDKPTTWSELRAWQELTCTPMLVWELRLMKSLSSVYLNAVKKYDGKDEISPVELLTRLGGFDIQDNVRTVLMGINNG